MVNVFRKYRQPLLIAFTIFTIFSFVFLYNNTDPSQVLAANGDRVAVVYGKGVTLAQYLRGSRRFELGMELRLMELLGALAAPGNSEDQWKENFVLNTIVLHRECERLGIAVHDGEVEAEIKAMPVFQTSGQFDPQKYSMIVQNALTPRGFGPDQLEDLVRDDILLKKLKALLAATTAAAPSQVRETYERDAQKTNVTVVRLKTEDFAKEITLTDEDLKKGFEERKATYNAPEKRVVKVVTFKLDEKTKLEGKERVEAQGKLMEKANDFSQALLEKGADFDAVAKNLGLEVKKTAEFASDAPPAELDGNLKLTRAVFQMTKEEPTSDVLNTEKGYYIVHLESIVPQRPLTFEEAKTQLATAMKDERSMEALNLKGAEIRNKLDAAMKEGKSFSDAAAAIGVKAEVIPAFSRREPPKNGGPDTQEILGASADVAVGQMSNFVPTASGGIIVSVLSREPIDETQFEKDKSMIAAGLSRGVREGLFNEWLKARRKEADIRTAPSKKAA